MTKKKSEPITRGGMELEALSGGLDQPMKIKAQSFGAMFNVIDSVLAEAKATGNDATVYHLFENFATASQVIGISLAKLLYGTLQIWPQITGVEYKDHNDRRMHFVQTMFSKYGYSKERVSRYLLAWEFIVRHDRRMDATTKARLLSRPMKDLIALGQNCKENGDFTAPQLKQLAATEDNGSLRKKIAAIRTGDEGNAKTMMYSLDDDGTLTVWEGGTTAVIGYIAVNPDDGPELGARAIARLKKKLGIEG